MSKKVTIGAKPTSKADVQHAEQWVQNRNIEGTKRLTLDIPASLHSRIKAICALRGTKMANEIRQILEENFKEDML